jgi:hypothetical protein
MKQEGHASESYLNSLGAEILLRRQPEQRLRVALMGLQAVANAFVMLGHMPEVDAEAILTEHRLALNSKGIGTGGVELTVRPGAHGYWDARLAGSSGLTTIPLSVAASQVCCPVHSGAVQLQWITLTPGGLRARAQVSSKAPISIDESPILRVSEAVSQVSMRDNHGQCYRLIIEDGRENKGVWHGELIAEPRPREQISWLHFSPVGGDGAARVAFLPSLVPVGRTSPDWPTPAEGYLAAIARVTAASINGVKLGPNEVAELVAMVADGLLAVGALPVDSPLIREITDHEVRGWRFRLMHRWAGRVLGHGQDSLPHDRLGLAVRLPLEHATAVIEWISVHDDQVCVQLYGHPWVMGEYWPMAIPCFELYAVDDAGIRYRAFPASEWRAYPSAAGSGDFLFWPPVPPGIRHLRVIANTLWEAAWADIELPGRG